MEQQVTPSQKSKNKSHHLRILLSILVLSLASLACPPTIPYSKDTVSRIQVEGDQLIASVIKEPILYYYEDPEMEVQYYASPDGGKNWHPSKLSVVADSAAYQELSNPLSVTKCLSDQPSTCFRIDQQPRIMLSTDSGSTWRTDWQANTWRIDFKERYLENVLSETDVYVSMVPYDLTLLATDKGETPVVAMGNQGIMVRDTDGNWSAYAVNEADPTPEATSSIDEILELLGFEQFFIILATVVCPLLLSPVMLNAIIANNSDDPNRNLWKALIPLSILLVGIADLSLNFGSPGLVVFSVLFLIAHFVIALWYSSLITGFLSLLYLVGFWFAFFFILLTPYILWMLIPMPYIVWPTASIVFGMIFIVYAALVMAKYPRFAHHEISPETDKESLNPEQ